MLVLHVRGILSPLGPTPHPPHLSANTHPPGHGATEHAAPDMVAAEHAVSNKVASGHVAGYLIVGARCILTRVVALQLAIS